MKNDLDTIMSSNVNEAIIKDPRLYLKKSNQKNLCDFFRCTHEIMVRSNMQRSIRKEFLANEIKDEGLKLYSIFLV